MSFRAMDPRVVSGGDTPPAVHKTEVVINDKLYVVTNPTEEMFQNCQSCESVILNQTEILARVTKNVWQTIKSV